MLEMTPHEPRDRARHHPVHAPGSASNENEVTFTSSQVSAGALVYAGTTYQQYATGMYGQASYHTRFTVPDNGTGAIGSGGFSGCFYSFQVGSVLFISLDANDVAYQDSGAFTATQQTTSGVTIPPNTGVYNRQYTGQLGTPNEDSTVPPGSNVQTQWLANTLESAAADDSIDWIIVQMHQPALSSNKDNGCDLGSRRGLAPSVRSVPSRPGALRARPQLRAVVPCARPQRRSGNRDQRHRYGF